MHVSASVWDNSEVSGVPKPPAKRPASLKMIADHLGLSPAAISRVLNGVPQGLLNVLAAKVRAGTPS